MATSLSSPTLALPNNRTLSSSVSTPPYPSTRSSQSFQIRRSPPRITAVTELPGAASPAEVVVSWQIIVGTAAGVTPFVVAAIEFSKRIMAQRKCGQCNGSGLVMRERYYRRCPRCGGFLPWQSWKRFFSG